MRLGFRATSRSTQQCEGSRHLHEDKLTAITRVSLKSSLKIPLAVTGT